MKRESIIWTSVLLVGLILVGIRAVILPYGMGSAYVLDTPVLVDDANPNGQWMKADPTTFRQYNEAVTADPNQTAYRYSWTRTIGIWTAALLTLFVLSFLFKDNPLYKIAESTFIGLSAAYWMVVAFWDTIVPNLLAKLAPGAVRSWAMPGLPADTHWEPMYIIPLILGGMLLWRLAPKGGWISRWPMAFFIGTFCGLRLVSFLHADFLSQIRNSIEPLYALDAVNGGFDLKETFRGIVLFVGVISCLIYFFFSIEHKGAVGKVARLGIWFLMITFGAAFGYTVMGRIALLAIRFEFLMDDWLNLIDPSDKRAVETIAEIVQSLPIC